MSHKIRVTGVRRKEVDFDALSWVLWIVAKQRVQEKREREARDRDARKERPRAK